MPAKRVFNPWAGLLGLALTVLAWPEPSAAQAPPLINDLGTFGLPLGLALGPNGDVLVVGLYTLADIKEYDFDGNIVRAFGSGSSIEAHGVGVLSDSSIIVADYFGARILDYAPGGQLLTAWPTGGEHAFFLAVDESDNIYVTDDETNRVRKFSGHGIPLGEWESLHPSGIAYRAGVVYVAARTEGIVSRYTSDGIPLGSFVTGSTSAQQLTTDAAGRIYLADWGAWALKCFMRDGTPLWDIGPYIPGYRYISAQFRSVAIAPDGTVFGGDYANKRFLYFRASPAPVVMAFDLTPNTLNLSSQGLWVTGFFEPASPLAASDIDIASIRLNGTVPVDPAAPAVLGDHDFNGVPDLMVKFDRAAVELTVFQGDSVPVNVTGTVEGHSFSGTDYIRVRHVVVSAPVAGSHLTSGSVTPVRWQTPSEVMVETVALLGSLDGGGTWELIARGQPNTGTYEWMMPNVQTDQAKVAVVLVESADETGYIVDGVLGVSETFAIEGLLGVDDRGPAQLALRGVMPNPAKHGLRASFSLEDSKAATLTLFDVSGRQVAARRIEEMGPGWHTVMLGSQSNLPAGLYVIRLSQGGRNITTRATLIR